GRRGRARGANQSRAQRGGQPRLGSSAVQERRRKLRAGAELGTNLSNRGRRAREGARATLRGHGGPVSGARRRLVESKRGACRHFNDAAFPAGAVMIVWRTYDEYFEKPR